MFRTVLLAGFTLAALPALAVSQTTPVAGQERLTMEQIMANPDWIGPAVEQPYWSVDSRSIYYSLKRDGSQIRDLYRVDPVSGKSVKLTAAEQAGVDGSRAVFDAAHTRVAFTRHGDVFVRDLASGKLTQLTRTPDYERGVQWSSDDTALQYRSDGRWYSHDFATGTTSVLAVLKSADDPAKDQPDQRERLQLQLFKTLRHMKAEQKLQREHAQALDAADATRGVQPFWMGRGVKVADTSLSPDGRWMLVVTQREQGQDGKHPVVNHYVTFSGYNEQEKARPYVGSTKPPAQSLWLLDLHAHHKYRLSLDALPGIHKDPLAKLRKQRQAELRKAGHADEARALNAPGTRSVSITGFVARPMVWSEDGKLAAVELRANDNKDRWIASVDLAGHKLVTRDHLHDPAWINWNFNNFGFLPHSHVLWFVSEADGYAHLYTRAPGARARQLTSGHFEVSQITPSADGKWIYLKANREAPYAYDVYRLPAGGGDLQRVTRFEAIDGFELAPDGRHLAVLHSSAYLPPQLAVVDVNGQRARELTDTRTAAFKAIDWVEPQFVKVPSSHGAGSIYAKLWVPKNFDADKPHPAVFFVHGAGYLQDVTKGWTYYFREQMFNNLLNQEGYVVIDMDYRASAGYGRDWRTAIYRRMGHPELQDLLDGKAWLVRHYHVDPNRVGIYGGSYGGFMTEIALLRAPGEFAAGAALRPPSDWTTYNDLYTSDILNDPQLDPEAYRISSPIEYAANLVDPLLIEHGLIDNNVMPDDSIRLYQRLIELHKKNFWISLYPLERHGFEHPDSWYDEYRRIHELFTRYVKNRYSTGLPVAKAPVGQH